MLPFHTLDVFTQTPFTGNPLAVVLQAGGLTTAQMQTIAREFNLSETVFVRPAADPAHTASLRIFLPHAEIPFAGHPTIGCAILLAEQAHGPGDWDIALTLEEAAGLVPVTVSRRAGVSHAELTAPVIPRRHPGRAEPALAAAALGLPPAAIGLSGHVPAPFAGGLAFLYIPLADRIALARACPVAPHWTALMQMAQVDMAYLYTPGNGTDWQARVFAPASGVPEDAATGSATVIFAAQLLASGALRDGQTSLTLLQGAEMGRPSHLTLTVEVAAGDLTTVRVAGSAVRIMAGQITPPSP